MLFTKQRTPRKSIEIHYTSLSQDLIQIEGIGWEHSNSKAYRWADTDRGNKSLSIFQYTLSGCGKLRIGNKVYEVPRNHAFLCTVPSDHEYYLPEGQTHWEYIFVSIYGNDALKHWFALIDQLGPVFELPLLSSPLPIFEQLYTNVMDSPSIDRYNIAALLYQFIVEMHRYADSAHHSKPEDTPASLMRSIELMNAAYREDLSLDQLAAASGLTKSHYCRFFHKHIGISPMHYLRKVRVERAAWLLRNTDLKLAEIGGSCGFRYMNYFIKIFRQAVGMTPGEYRSQQGNTSSDSIRLEG